MIGTGSGTHYGVYNNFNEGGTATALRVGMRNQFVLDNNARQTGAYNFYNGDGTGTPGDGVAATDEDDKDSERVEVCDDVVPTIVGTPANITIDCEVTIPTAPAINELGGIIADDLCDEDDTDMVLVETTTKGNDPNDCTFYNYAITRIWTATDECGLSLRHNTKLSSEQRNTKPPHNTLNT